MWCPVAPIHGRVSSEVVKATARFPDAIYLDPLRTADTYRADAWVTSYVAMDRLAVEHAGKLINVVIRWEPHLASPPAGYVITAYPSRRVSGRLEFAGGVSSVITKSPVPEVLSVILAGLRDAEWDYIPDGGWMEVFLAGSRGLGGVVEPLGDDLEISVHPETNVPLSIIIPGFRAWLGRQEGTAPAHPDCAYQLRCGTEAPRARVAGHPRTRRSGCIRVRDWVRVEARPSSYGQNSGSGIGSTVVKMEERLMRKLRSEDVETTGASDALPAPLVAQALEKTQIAKYHIKGGLGFAAEDANNFVDTIRGKSAEIVGISYELNGADRVVDGLLIQSKYFQSAPETVAAAFDSSSGNYRYTGQVLEVPKDQYEACVELMRGRIKQGKVPGFSNPADAEKVVQRGTVTYKQARNIARAGNVDSLIFDAGTQAVTSTFVATVSFVVTFAQSRWRGGEHARCDEGVPQACNCGWRHNVNHRDSERTATTH